MDSVFPEIFSLAWALALDKNAAVRVQKVPAPLTGVFIPMLREYVSGNTAIP